MKLIITSFAVVALLHLGWAQDIVLKGSFNVSAQIPSPVNRLNLPLDVNDDGILEIPTLYGYLDKTSWHEFVVRNDNGGIVSVYYYPQQEYCAIVTVIRHNGIAEYVINQYGLIVAYDIASGDIVFSNSTGNRLFALDYDLDGLDDICIQNTNTNEVSVYGIATGSPPISPPQDLDIQAVGSDYVITWTPVSNATAYRVLWSSDLDGVSFTRIGYTTGTTFTHRNQAGLPQGFYRVMSEDNGTGVVRMVGATTSGNSH